MSEDLIACLQGAIPAQIVTANASGMPNVSIISQVYYVDDAHVAISNQFFSKTFQNLAVNKKASVQVLHPEEITMWILQLEQVDEVTEGPLFDEMVMQLDVIASMTGKQGIFKLKSAYIFRVVDVKHLTEANRPL